MGGELAVQPTCVLPDDCQYQCADGGQHQREQRHGCRVGHEDPRKRERLGEAPTATSGIDKNMFKYNIMPF